MKLLIGRDNTKNLKSRATSCRARQLGLSIEKLSHIYNYNISDNLNNNDLNTTNFQLMFQNLKVVCTLFQQPTKNYKMINIFYCAITINIYEFCI